MKGTDSISDLFDDDDELESIVNDAFGFGGDEATGDDAEGTGGAGDGDADGLGDAPGDEDPGTDGDDADVSDGSDDHPSEDVDAGGEDGGDDDADGEGEEPDVDADTEVGDDEEGDEPETEAEGDAEPRKLTLKVGGVEQELDEDAVIALAQKAAGADARFREAAQLREENEHLVNLGQAFQAQWEQDPVALVTNLIDDIEDHDRLFGQMLQRSLALGRMPQPLAQRLGLDEATALQAKVTYQQQQLDEQQRRAEEQAAQAGLDPWGYSDEQYREIIPQLVQDAGIPLDDVDAAREFLQEIQRLRIEQNIADPYRALVLYQASKAHQVVSDAQVEAARARAAAQAARKPAKAKRVPGGGVPNGQVPDRAPEPLGLVDDDEEAARQALLRRGLLA